MLEFFIKGGPVMWPLLLVSVATLTIVVERAWFLVQEAGKRKPKDLEAFFHLLERGKKAEALAQAQASSDFVTETLGYALNHREVSFTSAFLQASKRVLGRFNRGLSVLDTVITLAPLLGLLGTVTGLIHSFGLLGDQELAAPTALTGGIAQALIATAFGLIIAVTALIPFNFLNAQAEKARQELEEAGTQLELILMKEKS